MGKELVRRISISCGVVLFCIIEARELYDALVFELDCVDELMVLAKSFSTVWLEKYGDVNPYNSKVSAQNTQMNGERTLLGQYPKPYRYLDRRYLPGTRYANHEQWSSYQTYLKEFSCKAKCLKACVQCGCFFEERLRLIFDAALVFI